jgi:type I restriction enzyme S subunit
VRGGTPLSELMAKHQGSINPIGYPDETFCLYSIPAFDKGEPEILPGNSIGSAKQIVCPGDVLLSRIVPHIRRAWIVGPHRKHRIIASGEWIVFRSHQADPRYLRHFLTSDLFHAKFMRTVAGVGGSLLRARPTQVGEIRVPLPSVPEQQRVADILDKADIIRRKRKETIALTEELLRSAFLEIFGDPVMNPKQWRPSTFGQEVETLEYGPRFYNEKYSDDGIRIVRITDLDSTGRLDFSAMPRLVVDPRDKAKYTLRPGDLIFARSGATVGKTALSMPGDPEAIPGAYFIRLRFKSTVKPLFARQVLASERIQQIIVSRSRQSAQQNFSGPGIRELPLPVPPVETQERFERVTNNQRSLLRDCRLAEAESNRLLVSLLHRAFAGSLGGFDKSC